MENRAGKFVKNLSGEAMYQSFLPSALPPIPPIDLNLQMIDILIKAKTQLSLLEYISKKIPNIELFVSMYIRKEALLSSQIEGTQATLEDIFNTENEENVNLDVKEVINYIKATEFAINRLKTLPLCNRLLKETHSVLLENGRGCDKTPGEFRHSQNWIGGVGSTLKTAKYIPPNFEDMQRGMSDLEKFINSDDDIDPLIKIALIHYQFETIHPFLDGNGRIGRLLIILFLIQKKILTSPSLYISYYLKKNRVEYYDRMSEVRKSGNYEQWVMFFLTAIYETCIDAIDTIESLSSLSEKNEKLINSIPSIKKNGIRVFKYIESTPIVEIGKTAETLNLSFNTVSKIIHIFCDNNILVQSNNKSRNRSFVYRKYMSILKKDT